LAWANYRIVLYESADHESTGHRLGALKELGYESFELLESQDGTCRIVSEPVHFKVDLLLPQKDLSERGFKVQIVDCADASKTSILNYPNPSLPFNHLFYQVRASLHLPSRPKVSKA